MKRAMLTCLMLISGSVAAQAQDAPPQASSAAQIKSSPPQYRPPVRSRRRASMVGYLDDGIVESKVRVRFDVALHNEVPDRAEFFYAKCGCYSQIDIHDLAFDPEAPGPKPGAATDLNFQQLFFRAEGAMSRHTSAFFEVPIRWIRPQGFAGGGSGFDNQSGISDMRAGAKFDVSSGSDHNVTVQLQAFFPTGNASKALGTDHFSIEPSLLYNQRADRVTVESQFGFWHPVGGSDGFPITSDKKFAGDVLFYGVGVSPEVYSGSRVSFGPVIELAGWRVLNGFQTVGGAPQDATGTNIVHIKFGVRVVSDGGSSVYLGYGHAVTTAKWYKDIVRFEYRYAF